MKEKTNLKKSKANFESFGDVEIYNLKKQKMLFNSLTQRGITLIALVVSIIVLLILVGISIQMLTGDNGILKRASEAKTKSIAANEEEAVKLAAQEALTQGLGTIDTDNLTEALKSNFGEKGTLKGQSPAWLYTSENNKMYSISKSGKVTIIEKLISKTDSYVGKYADVDGDGTVDGIIYADLAMKTTSGEWGNSNGTYTITKVENVDDLGEYYISATGYKGGFNDPDEGRDVITLASGGTERFYVMALMDFTADGNGAFDWYNAATDNMGDWSSTTSTAFGAGKQNTANMISKWNSEYYGVQDNCTSHKDMWGQIQPQVNKGWYVPSREEWAAFANAFEITSSNFRNFKLGYNYWSSSLRTARNEWYVHFLNGLIQGDVSSDMCLDVRLATTF
jgi:Tfp pilus assembly protein PilX